MMPSDAELVAQIRAHNADAFEALSIRYREIIYRHVFSTIHDSDATEDVVQEVFLRIWTHAEQWNGRGTFKAWLFRIATNFALNHLRTLRRRKQQLAGLLSTQGAVRDIQDQQVAIRHGYREGLQPIEIYALAIGAREQLAQTHQEWRQIEQEIHKRSIAKSFSVLARAMRAEQPGIVFAHAASIGEIDPLTERDSRLFVGLPV